MTETPPSDDDLKLLKRNWPFGFDPDPDLVWAMAEEIYGGAKNWEDEEFAVDLATLRPVRKGGLASKGRIDRMMMKRWRSGERPIPEWVAYGLLRLPEIVLARRQKDVDRWLGELKAEDGKARDFIAAEEVRLAAWVASQLEQRVPMIERDPVKRPPPPRPPTPDREWPPVSAEEVERAEDIGSLAAKVAMGVVEPEPAPRPEHPALADAWDRGWSEAYDYELAGMREAEERQAAGEAAALAIRERELAFVAKEHARREARRAAALKRKLAK